eukprot:831733_1
MTMCCSWDSEMTHIVLHRIYTLNRLHIRYYFIKTESANPDTTWPSDGFHLPYSLNDFSNDINETYHIVLQSNNPKFDAHITLDPSNDGCVCNTTDYGVHCDDCNQHFHLQNYLSPGDNNIGQIVLTPMMYHSDALMLPQTIPITLTRCNISFYYVDKSTTKTITFRFNLSQQCHNRTGIRTTFSLSI